MDSRYVVRIGRGARNGNGVQAAYEIVRVLPEDGSAETSNKVMATVWYNEDGWEGAGSDTKSKHVVQAQAVCDALNALGVPRG